MRSLTFKLTLAFFLVGLTGVALVAVFARLTTTAAFDRYRLETFRAEAAEYYQTNGSWTGVTEHFRRPILPPQAPPPGPGSTGGSNPPPQGPLPRPEAPFSLVDQGGYVVVPAGGYHVGDRVPPTKLERGVAVEVEGQVVGTVLTVAKPNQPSLDPLIKDYLEGTNKALFFVALGASGAALLLGILLARTLTRPLRELTSATRAMAKGELEQQVSIRSQDELGELAASFNQMSADLARANQLRRQMTADIAHDLRTPLSVITGYTEALHDGVLPPTPETFQTIHKEAEHLSLLVKDLRTLSLADAGELTLTRQLLHPQELLERMAAAHLPHAQQLEVALQITAKANVPAVNVDPERMAQVLGNLLSNALRHTPAGGQISLGAMRRGDRVLLTVQDTGGGIAPDELSRIFDRFYQGDEARQVHEGESGLGLTIAKSIVELHGGTITVESTLGEGTTFTIALPVGSY